MRDGDNRITPPRTGWIRGYGKPHSLDFDISMKDMPPYVPPSQQKQFVKYDHVEWPSKGSWDAATEVINKASSRLRWKARLRWCSLLAAYISLGIAVGYLIRVWLMAPE